MEWKRHPHLSSSSPAGHEKHAVRSGAFVREGWNSLPPIRVSLFFAGNHLPFRDITAKIGILFAGIHKKDDWPVASILDGVAEATWEFRTDK